MSKHHWVSVIGALLVGGSGYLLIALVGCGAVNTAVDTMEKQEEEEKDADANHVLASRSLKEIRLDSSFTAVEDAKEDAEGFRFPEDRGGQILSKVLPPSEKAVPPAEREAPSPRRHPPSGLDKPSLPLPPVPAEMPRLPAGQ